MRVCNAWIGNAWIGNCQVYIDALDLIQCQVLY